MISVYLTISNLADMNKIPHMIILLLSLFFLIINGEQDNLKTNDDIPPFRVYFGEYINENERRFIYHKINFIKIYKDIAYVQRKCNDEKLNPYILQIINKFEAFFQVIYQRKPPRILYNNFTCYTYFFSSVYSLPDLHNEWEKFMKVATISDITMNLIYKMNNTLNAIKKIITLSEPNSLSYPEHLPYKLKLPTAAMRFPIWVNNLKRGKYFVEYELYSYFPILMPLLFPLPLPNPPPYNTIFNLQKIENKSFYLAKAILPTFTLSTIINSVDIENCNITSNICFLSGPKNVIIKEKKTDNYESSFNDLLINPDLEKMLSNYSNCSVGWCSIQIENVELFLYNKSMIGPFNSSQRSIMKHDDVYDNDINNAECFFTQKHNICLIALNVIFVLSILTFAIIYYQYSKKTNKKFEYYTTEYTNNFDRGNGSILIVPNDPSK